MPLAEEKEEGEANDDPKFSGMVLVNKKKIPTEYGLNKKGGGNQK